MAFQQSTSGVRGRYLPAAGSSKPADVRFAHSTRVCFACLCRPTAIGANQFGTEQQASGGNGTRLRVLVRSTGSRTRQEMDYRLLDARQQLEVRGQAGPAAERDLFCALHVCRSSQPSVRFTQPEEEPSHQLVRSCCWRLRICKVTAVLDEFMIAALAKHSPTYLPTFARPPSPS